MPTGLQLIALLEATKGFVVLTAGLGVLEYIHLHMQTFGEHVLQLCGLNPQSEHAQSLAHLLSGVTEQKILLLASGVVLYSVLRFIEAFGLWKERNWARWFGIVSGGIYLPYEVYELIARFSWMKVAVTVINILIVLYLIRSRGSKAPVTKKSLTEIV
ncbi:DUF2127 domain-containing protein [Bdellovibrio sp. 22V]|uniref:DUF2127 domain-containing protein n=1 Tax=Bdellovibrio TaxID=958 RepID=UPI0025439F6F|nr:DUF2127 domain-containing protein [Bdellovibrio sp. 22V]WII73201.1 DUF2127 domain-containing protein [Bdellovibrio sp. 22V]